MISSVTNEKCFEFRGLKADFDQVKDNEKFNKQVGNGSVFFTMDDCNVYMFDEASKTWKAIE